MKMRLLSTAALACVVILLSGCTLPVVQGSGYITSQDRTASGFSQVDLQGSGDIFLMQGDTEGVRVEADDNLMDYIETEVRGDTLLVGYKSDLDKIISPSQAIHFYVSLRTVKGLTITGSGSISAKSVEAESLVLNINGSGDVLLDSLKAKSVDCAIRGSGKCVFAGNVESQSAEIYGSGKYIGNSLQSKTASILIAGSGNAALRVSDTLDVNITGSGNVDYSGTPRVREHITGSGEVSSEDV